MKSVFTKEAKIGLVTIVSLALCISINYLKGINLFQPGEPLLRIIQQRKGGDDFQPCICGWF